MRIFSRRWGKFPLPERPSGVVLGWRLHRSVRGQPIDLSLKSIRKAISLGTGTAFVTVLQRGASDFWRAGAITLRAETPVIATQPRSEERRCELVQRSGRSPSRLHQSRVSAFINRSAELWDTSGTDRTKRLIFVGTSIAPVCTASPMAVKHSPIRFPTIRFHSTLIGQFSPRSQSSRESGTFLERVVRTESVDIEDVTTGEHGRRA
jgi:hypothetical protein